MKKPLTFTGIYIIFAILLPAVISNVIPNGSASFLNSYDLIMYTALAVIAMTVFRTELRDTAYEIAAHPMKILVVSLVSIMAVLMCTALLLAITGGSAATENQTAVEKMLSSSLWSIPVVIFFGPLVEEVVFRHILIGRFSEKMPLWLLCILSVILFGLIHIHTFSAAGILEIRQYLILGLVYTGLYAGYRKNLSYPLAAHMINNLITVLLAFGIGIR